MTGFDRCRPMWEFTLIEHLVNGRAALVMKLHHSLTDGIGGMQLALLLFDVQQVAVPPGQMPDAPLGERPDGADMIRGIVTRDLERVSRVGGQWARSAVPAWRTARHPLSTVAVAMETTRSIGRTVAPLRETLSPIMKGQGLQRHLDMVEVGLDDLKRAAAAAGGTINDVFLAAVTGGLRRYHERHGTSVEGLRVTLPISIRTPDDRWAATASPSSVLSSPWPTPIPRFEFPRSPVVPGRPGRTLRRLHQRHRGHPQPAPARGRRPATSPGSPSPCISPVRHSSDTWPSVPRRAPLST